MSLSSSDLTRGVFIAEEPRHADTSHPKATTVSHYIPLAVGCAYITPELFFLFFLLLFCEQRSQQCNQIGRNLRRSNGCAKSILLLSNLCCCFFLPLCVPLILIRSNGGEIEEEKPLNNADVIWVWLQKSFLPRFVYRPFVGQEK